MSASDLAIVAGIVFLWGTLSARLERYDVTAPIIFVLAGLLLTHGPLAPLGFAPSHELVKALAEITLVLVLFSDASRVRLRDLRADAGLCLRLLGIGLPLTIGLGTLLAFALFNGMGIWLALLVGASLAPTDAALGAGVMVNPAVPARIRRLLNIESGLNERDRNASRAGGDRRGRDRRARGQRRSRCGSGGAGGGRARRCADRRRGRPGRECGAPSRLGRGRFRRLRGAGPGHLRLRLRPGAARERLHRRVRRRPGLRRHRREAR